MAQRKKKDKGSKMPGVVIAFRVISVILLFFLVPFYIDRDERVYAVTIWPAIVWSGLGFLLLLPGIRRYRNRQFYALVGAWLGLALVFSEEWIGLSHLFSAAALKPDLTVVTLNCAGGNPLAANEVGEYHPDLVLLQESPSSTEIADLTRKLYGKEGASLPGADASIVVHGTIEPMALPRATNDFVAAHVTLWNGRKLVVVSLRLAPPVFRLDYWSADCWREYSDSYLIRQKELRGIMDYLLSHTKDEPIILGGDFNTPPEPGIFECMHPRLRDVYPESGTLWGYTAVNEFPLARIDQIWVSRNFKALDTTAFKTEHSDHRLVRVKLRFSQD